MAEDITLPFMYEPFIVVMPQIYFAILAVLVLIYAIKSKNDPEKRNNPEFFINEILIVVLYVYLIIVYPNLFENITEHPGVKAQIYFHNWDSFTIHFIVWFVVMFFWRIQNNKRNYFPNFEEWTQNKIECYDDCVKADIKRKFMHFLPTLFIIGFHYIGVLLEPLISEAYWDANDLSIFFTVCVGLHFLMALTILDLLRLNKKTFNLLNKFAHEATASRLRPDEFYTINSGVPMVLVIAPFTMTFPAMLFCTSMIGSLSDAAASIIGKRFGKVRSKKPGAKKTLEGYLAGFTVTYLIVLFVNSFMPFPEVGNNWLVINLMALAAAIGFLLVDRFVKKVSDNILNPLVCGALMLGVYYLFITF